MGVGSLAEEVVGVEVVVGKSIFRKIQDVYTTRSKQFYIRAYAGIKDKDRSQVSGLRYAIATSIAILGMRGPAEKLCHDERSHSLLRWSSRPRCAHDRPEQILDYTAF